MRRAICLACALLASALPAEAQAPGARPVLVGGEVELDACTSVGAIISMRKRGDGLVAVRAAPSKRAPMRDQLKSGRKLMICEYSEDGKWLGVVYPEKAGRAELGDCGVSEPISGPPRPYNGPCRSGWVSQAYVLFIAG